MSKLTVPFLYDVMGSILRPEYLKKARSEYRDNKISKEELKKLEDKAIRELIKTLSEHGYKMVTDGEYRRGWYHSDFLAELGGIEFTTYTMNLFGQETLVGSTKIIDHISWNENHPFIEHFRFANEVAKEYGAVCKLDIPGPNMVFLDTITTDQENFYGKDIELLSEDFIKVYRGAIKSFYEAGCRYLQLDDPVWVALCDDGFKSKIIKAGFEIEKVKEVFYKTAKAILETKPEDLAITLHMCQGNLRSRKFYDATYDEIADTIFSLPFDGFFMEFDDDKYCDFRILRKLKGQRVALGLVSTRSDELEDKAKLVAKVKDAANYVNIDQLSVSTQCGFASTADGNLISEEAQWKKLDLVRDVAIEAFGL
ncbi:MAG: 5-methyltetrahydropteroyltriglutamate--homocysteine S-methyltransferase [Erysipelotrichaceae bacterium]